MKVVLSGAERGTHRNVLVANSVQRVALNITGFTVPKTKAVDLKALVGGAEVFVYSSDGDEDVDKFDEFVRTHADDITVVIGRPDYDGDWLGDKWYPLWNDDQDLERLAHLCQRYGRVAVSDRALNGKTIPRINQLKQRWGANIIGISSKVDTIESVDFDTVIVSSWTSVVRYGETQIWDGHGLRRYPAQKKDSARRSHRNDIVRLGIDYEAIEANDVGELARLAVKSWLAWESHAFGSPAYHPSVDDDEQEFDSTEQGGIATTPPSSLPTPKQDSHLPGITTSAPMQRHESEQQLLPVLGIETVVERTTFTTPDGEEVEDDQGNAVKVVRQSNKTIRSCNSCYLAPRCPAFQEHSECAYKIPVEIRTKQQLQAVLTAMLEMQTSRVLFARFAEELEGTGMDPALSAEIDRLFKLVQTFKDIEDTRDVLSVTMEARGSAGVLSRIFGEKAATKANELSQPLTDEQVDDMIIDAQILDND